MTSETQKPLSYREAGVDIEAGNLAVEKIKSAVRSTYRPEVLGDLGGFGGLFSLNAASYEQPVLVSGTDGVGTKLKIAFLMDRHDTIGRDVVAMCVNDVLAQGAEPLFFLDYLAVGRLDPAQAAAVVGGVAAGCRESGCALIGGETAEMAGFYAPGEYDLAGFCVGVAEKARLLPSPDLAPGDVVLGLPSSGLHSNGFSLVRKICFERMNFKVTDYIDELGGPLGEELLKPTRLYPRLVLPLLARFKIKAIVHITGGGFQENLPRALPGGLALRIDPTAWAIPPIFRLLQRWGQVAEAEMFRTFNMGLGLALIAPPAEADALAAALRAAGEDARIIGRLEAGQRRTILEGVTE
ncbi:MAG: phosphoribosylformylglycinamidine cyclo-ligase [Candidatus Adiutrix sp.]|jgi:phosphoribosylformylglycinamidine cyclo-ligase|nr:phosphoribosylformylglycinamidine cyclo-ligase [Candidatus Adiutrix sp.]